MSAWNRRRAILAGIAAMFTPAVAKGTPAAAFNCDNEFRRVGAALNSDGYIQFGAFLLVTNTTDGMKVYNIGGPT